MYMYVKSALLRCYEQCKRKFHPLESLELKLDERRVEFELETKEPQLTPCPVAFSTRPVHKGGVL